MARVERKHCESTRQRLVLSCSISWGFIKVESRERTTAERESENEHENNLAILSSIDPITTTSTSTGDSECVSKYIFSASGV